MKCLILFGLLIFSLSISAQEQELTRIYNAVLKSGKQLAFGDTSIRFKGVVSNSRCLKNLTCLWAGEAKVLIGIFERGKLVSEQLVVVNPNMEQEIPLHFSAGNGTYSLSAIELFPYPCANLKKIKTNYSLKLQVSEHVCYHFCDIKKLNNTPGIHKINELNQ